MHSSGVFGPLYPVALLAEGVDRNSYHSRHILLIPRSPSSRRAWIEILCLLTLTKEVFCRPPRGGRG